MNKEALTDIIEKISSYGDIQLSDIPCIDLYVDQVTTLFDDKLADTKRDPSDKILTKTMINNYTKAKTLMPPKNKKYSKNHIILLSLIYNLKQILSINDIKLLFAPLFNGTDASKGALVQDLEDIYSTHLAIKKDDLDNLPQNFDDMLDHVLGTSSAINIGDNDKQALILLVLALVNQAAINKRLAEKIIDEFFNISK